eukprot:gene9097-biopygen2141
MREAQIRESALAAARLWFIQSSRVSVLSWRGAGVCVWDALPGKGPSCVWLWYARRSRALRCGAADRARTDARVCVSAVRDVTAVGESGSSPIDFDPAAREGLSG